VGNKLDLAVEPLIDASLPPPTPSSVGSTSASYFSTNTTATVTAGAPGSSSGTVTNPGLGTQLKATIAPDGREVSAAEASRWASSVSVPVTIEVSAFSGEGVDEVFGRLARMILTKIELGEIDPDDPMSGIQYGDAGGGWNGGASDGASIKSSMTADEAGASRRRRGRGRGKSGVGAALRDWEEVFTLSGRRRGQVCSC
jgi:hypothetical protein